MNVIDSKNKLDENINEKIKKVNKPIPIKLESRSYC